MKYIDVINQGQNRLFKMTFWLVVLSTGSTWFEFACNFLIFNRPSNKYYEFLYTYHPALGAGLCAFFLLRTRWAGVSFIMPLFMWILFSRLSHPMPPTAYSTLESLVYMVGVLADLGVWVMMFFLILVSLLKLRFLRRLHQHLEKNPDSLQALEEQAAVTRAAVTLLPKIGLHLHDETSQWDVSRRALLVVIALVLLMSPVFWVLQVIPTNVEHALEYKPVTAVIYDFAASVYLPTFFSAFAAVMIFKKWEPISYLIPLQISFLWASAFIWQIPDDRMPHELIAHTLGRYTDRALIGLILLNTLLLPIDWVKGFRAKKTAQAS